MKTNIAVRAFLCVGIALSGSVISPAHAADIGSLTGSCQDCHGKDGASQHSDIPTIGGFSAAYTTDSLAAYRDKSRPCADVKYPAGEHKGETTNMCKAVEKLSAEETGLIADYFASKPFIRAKQAFDASLAQKGKGIHELKCKKCHEDGGSSPDDDAGILAGQWMPYLQTQFEEYAAKKRPMTEKMVPKMQELSADDKKALIHYYGSRQ